MHFMHTDPYVSSISWLSVSQSVSQPVSQSLWGQDDTWQISRSINAWKLADFFYKECASQKCKHLSWCSHKIKVIGVLKMRWQISAFITKNGVLLCWLYCFNLRQSENTVSTQTVLTFLIHYLVICVLVKELSIQMLCHLAYLTLLSILCLSCPFLSFLTSLSPLHPSCLIIPIVPYRSYCASYHSQVLFITWWCLDIVPDM